MPEVVSNTSPIQYLHQIGVLQILPALYGRILVPQAVVDEIGVGRVAGVNLPDPAKLEWLDVRAVELTPWPIPREIHAGEAEAIALAKSIGASVLILDDLAARRHAKLLGLCVTGTLGVLLKAKNSGLLERLLPHVERLDELGFRLADSTRQEFLQLAGE